MQLITVVVLLASLAPFVFAVPAPQQPEAPVGGGACTPGTYSCQMNALVVCNAAKQQQIAAICNRCQYINGLPYCT